MVLLYYFFAISILYSALAGIPVPTVNQNSPTHNMSQPASQPAGQPTNQPTNQPISQPISQPTNQPTSQPTSTFIQVAGLAPIANQECTWDRVQIPDPVTWKPAQTYEYNHESPGTHTGPTKVDPDVQRLVSELTLQEKIGQMTQIEVGQLLDCNGKLNTSAVTYWVDEWKVGSFLETPANHGGLYQWYSAKTFADLTDAVQQVAMSHGSRIPVLWGLDSVRGANYVKGAVIFPAGIAVAATFDAAHAYNSGRIAAKDTRAAGVHWAFAPILDVGSSKLWSRGYEGFGEDPYLCSRMGAQAVLGLQGDYKRDRSRVAACMKHFIGYGNPANGQDRGDRHISEREMLEYYAPPFAAAIEAGVASAMSSYGVVNGEAVTLSESLLKTLLRDSLGFRGMLVTDWGEIESQVTMYRTAKTVDDATHEALARTSVDMSMVADDVSFANITAKLVQDGKVSINRIDESVGRILQLKKDLGLFNRPFADRRLQYLVGSTQDIDAARDTVRESATLLKNENDVLPLKSSDRVLYLGPTLNSTRFMCGGWNVHWQGPSDEEGDAIYEGFGDTILKGLETVTGTQPVYLEGVDIYGNVTTPFGQIVAAARSADKIVIGLGEHTYAENFGNAPELALPCGQIEFVKAVAHNSNKPIVLVLVQGRARILHDAADIASSIIDAYLPGAYGGLPIAELLYGKMSPSGRLPLTYPRSESQQGTTVWQPAFMEYNPQWPFGFGLGYSHIEYSNLTVSSTSLSASGRPITVSVTLVNRGSYNQKEAVMLFSQQKTRMLYAPELYRLRNFVKIELKTGESRTVEFELGADELAFWDRDGKKRIEPGEIVISVNPFTQKDVLSEIMLGP